MKRMLLLVLVICSLHTSPVTAQTTIPAGNVCGTWTLAGSPYNVQGSILVPNDSTLIIQPGVIVKFQGSYKLQVQGRLLAVGTITDSVTFVPGDTAVGWRGIQFYNNAPDNDTSVIKYCNVMHCKLTDTYGAIHINGWSKLVLSNTSITESSHDGIYCTGNCFPQISNNYIAKNLNFGIECYFAYPQITHNLIINNSNTGMYCALSNNFTIHISDNIICNNSGSQGGGLYLDNGGYSIVSNNIIANNHCVGHGGGLYLKSAPNAQLLNNIIVNNSAEYSGGGIYCYDYSGAKIINTTISNNSAVNGGAIACVLSGNASFKNCIVWGNIASNSGSQVFLEDELSDPDFTYCDIQGGLAMFELYGNLYTGIYSNNINVNPLFVSPSGGSGSDFNGIAADWSLQHASSCIDAGDPASNSSSGDFAGNPRVTVCRIDIGAYEYQTGVPLVVSLNVTQPVRCSGDANGEITATVSGGNGTYSYLWSNGQTTLMDTGLVAGEYSVTVTDTVFGCALTNSITLTDPIPFAVAAGSDKSIMCGDVAQLDDVTSNYTGTGTLMYEWMPATGLNSASISNPATTATGITYAVTVTTPDGCTASDGVSVNLIPMGSIEICMVGVDSTNKNLVIWDKPVSLAIDSFYVYRETNITGNFIKIGAVSYDSLSVFGDITSQPDVKSNKYKISILDTCGLETTPGAYHKTMHLAINPGMGTTWNLIWDSYEGFIVSTYNIYRGTSSDNLQWLDATSGGNNQFTDNNPPSGYVYYQLEVVSPNSCNPTKLFNSSRSNIATNNTSGVDDMSNSPMMLSISPNPAADVVSVNLEGTVADALIVKIYDIMGSLVKNQLLTKAIRDSHLQIDIGDLNIGLYLIEIKSGLFTRKQKLFIQR